MARQNGFTLIELVIIIAILGVMTALALPSAQMIKKYRLNSATSELLSNLQKLRSDGLTSGSGANSRGFGVRFDSSTSYSLFEFVDCNGDFDFDTDGCSGDTEAWNSQVYSLPADIYLTKKNADMPAGEMLIYDKKGMARKGNWGMNEITIVVRHVSDRLKPGCLAVDTVRIREGKWNDTAEKCEQK